MPYSMNRKKFILLSGGMFAAFGIPAYYHFFGKIKYPDSLAHPGSLTPILDLKELKELGTLYRKQAPDESGERALADVLLEELPDDNLEFNTAINDLIKKDFDNGNTTEVNGWILSKTEARQCALLTFSTHASN
jgi:hypothetical protein